MKFMRAGVPESPGLLGMTWAAPQQSWAQQPPTQQAPSAARGDADCPAPAAGRSGRGLPPGAAATSPRKRVLAWADSRNGKAQHDYVSYALAQLQRMGHDSKAYDVIIRTDSDIISFHPMMTDGKTPASGGPSLCNIDAIIFAGHRNVPLSDQQKKDLIKAVHERGIGFVTLFIGLLPNDDFPEMANILGAHSGVGGVDVHDPWTGGSTVINEEPNSPFTKDFGASWTSSNGDVYQPELYDRKDIDVLLRKDLSKLPSNAKYTRTDGDYPAAWVKMYGKGHVFVSTLGNSEPLWDDPMLLKMYDQAIRWSLGDVAYTVKPHPLAAGVRGPSGPMPAAAPARGAPAE